AGDRDGRRDPALRQRAGRQDPHHERVLLRPLAGRRRGGRANRGDRDRARRLVTTQGPTDRAIATAAGLKPGTWEAVEALAILAIAAAGQAEAAEHLQSAQRIAAKLKAGTWDAVRALAWLARAERELGA